jgi:hypothetical protein
MQYLQSWRPLLMMARELWCLCSLLYPILKVIGVVPYLLELQFVRLSTACALLKQEPWVLWGRLVVWGLWRDSRLQQSVRLTLGSLAALQLPMELVMLLEFLALTVLRRSTLVIPFAPQ